MHPIAALETEYSLCTPDVEAEILPTARELGIGFVAYSPLGRGCLTGQITSPDDFADDDFRKSNPRFQGDNFQQNLRLVQQVQAIATDAGATPAQVPLAWLLTRGDDIAVIPGTKHVERLEENVRADALQLSPETLRRLDELAPAAGDRYEPVGAVQTSQ